jgi:hypothetical protein
MTRWSWPEYLALAAGGGVLWVLFRPTAVQADPLRSGGGSGGGSAPPPDVPEPVFLPLEVYAPGHQLILTVSEDYLPPMRGTQAQAVADAHGAMFPTRKLVDLIYDAAPIHLPFHAETVDRESQATIDRHLARTAEDRAGRRGIARGHAKDYILSNAKRAGRSVLYGGRYASGALVQSLYPDHVDSFVDYSMGGSLIDRLAVLDGRTVDLAAIMHDPVLSALVSDEGPLTATRYT